MFLRTTLALTALCLAPGTVHAGPYLFATFHGNGEDGLHLAYSDDGYDWTSVRNDASMLTPTVGSKLMRDPSIVQGPDGVFHMVWSSGWYDKGFGYSSSADLIHWTSEQFVGVNVSVADAQNTWAPDLCYDAGRSRYQITWATTIGTGSLDHRLYYTTTTDFKTFSEAQLLFDPGYSCIDGTILTTGDQYRLIFKDERDGQKVLKMSTADTPTGEFDTPVALPTALNTVEGPSAITIGSEYFVYYDHYANGQFYGAIKSSDFSTWTDVSSQMSFPIDSRHGCVFEVSQNVLNNLIGVPEPPSGLLGIAGLFAASGCWYARRRLQRSSHLSELWSLSHAQ